MSRPRAAMLAAAVLAACGGDDGEREVRVAEPPPAIEVRANDPEVVAYTLRFDDRKNHYIEVEGVLAAPEDGDHVVVAMAVWTPGSYLIREYARHIDALEAQTPGGERLDAVKVSKNRWRIATGGADRVAVRYRVYARELSVRNNYVTADIAMLNGAPTFLFPVGAEGEPAPRVYDVALEVPESWTGCATALPPHPGGDAHRYVARDLDHLLDAPIVCGTPATYDFEVEGVPHTLANFGEGGIFDGARAAADVEKLTATQIDFWGVVPYPSYVYLNVLWEAGGGLEHKGSTLMLGSKWATRQRDDYLRWLGLVSHEFFHTWNVKRLRPEALGPFDYEEENYTRSLWVAEGITSYYDDLLLRRAGISEDGEYLSALSGQIGGLQDTPGRLVQPLADASFDAWIKYYRWNENSNNTQVSYYTKGAVVAFLLDAEIRRRTNGARSLDDVMRLAYERHAGERGYTPAEFRAAAAEVAGAPLDDFFARYVDGTEELDYQPALTWFGLRFTPEPKKDGDGDDDETPGWLGVDLRGNTIDRIDRGTPAYEVGLNVGDEILGVDAYHVDGSLASRLERYRPGDEVELLVARRGRLIRIQVTLGEKPSESWKLEVDPQAPAVTAQRRRAWLAGE